MAVQYKTPGVYVVEIDASGSSIEASSTAVPIFIGFTEKAVTTKGQSIPLINGSESTRIPVKIQNMLEFTTYFGGPDMTGFMHITGGNHKNYKVEIIDKQGQPYEPALLHPSVINYFSNGGGLCYIISLGLYEDFHNASIELDAIIEAISEAEEATLILPVGLLRYEMTKYYAICNSLINHCAESGQLFCVLDVVMSNSKNTALDSTDMTNYRKEIHGPGLKYAAAYFPYINSFTPYAYDLSKTFLNDEVLLKEINIEDEPEEVNTGMSEGNIIVNEKKVALLKIPTSETDQLNLKITRVGKTNVSIDQGLHIGLPTNGPANIWDLTRAWNRLETKNGFEVIFISDINFSEDETEAVLLFEDGDKTSQQTADISEENHAQNMEKQGTFHQEIEEVKSFLSTNFITLPASPFLAGIYCRSDNTNGVWTAPANVALTNIKGPVVNITNRQHQGFYKDPTSGKSINAIRNFPGQGTLVYGTHTNDSNSINWRYVRVVRLFISIKTDISKALEAYTFQPNVHNTWVEVKTMIDSYLFGLYNAGAFAGTTPEQSYQVRIGEGESMNYEDVHRGYLRVDVGVAPVRPAEFINLTFSQLVGQ